MPVMIQVRNVPDSLHKELVRRAEARGMILTAYVQSVLEREVGRPSRAEIVRRALALTPVKSSVSSADLIRADRGPLPEWWRQPS
jgi:antitoxin FitA